MTRVETAKMEDIQQILKIEIDSWGPDLSATREQISSRIETFPEGCLVARANGEIQGFLALEIIKDYDFVRDAFTWDEITDNGFIKRTHDPGGKFMYGVDLSVPHYANRSVSALLITEGIKLTIAKGLKGVILGGRLPGYHKYAARMTPEEYVFSRRKGGKAYDPELAIYERFGLKAVKVLPDYFKDPESLNYGVLLYWPNPFKSSDKAEIIISFSPFIDLYSSRSRVYERIVKRPLSRWTLMLPGAGCGWAKRTGGCRMCGFKNSTELYTSGNLMKTVLFESLYEIGRASFKDEGPGVLMIYNGGSFLNDEEIPAEAQEIIAKRVGQDGSIKVLCIESRPEFIREEKITKLKELLGGKTLRICMGLEAKSDHVREKLIRKGITLEEYRRAVETAKRCGIEVLTYVFLKPFGLSESDAVEEAIKTIDYAFETGSDEVALQAAFVQPGTPLEKAYQLGEFRPPTLWSIVQVLKRVGHKKPVHLGGFSDEPPPIAVPESCEKCSAAISKAFDAYRLTMGVSFLENMDVCECIACNP